MIFNNSEGFAQKNDFVEVQYLGTEPTVKLSFDSEDITLNMFGEYNYINAAAAICIGRYFDISTKNIKSA